MGHGRAGILGSVMRYSTTKIWGPKQQTTAVRNMSLNDSLKAAGRKETFDSSFRTFLNCDGMKASEVYGPLVPAILDRCRDISYRIRPLSHVADDVAQNLIADSFVRKGDLEQGAEPALTAADFVPELKNAWPALLKHSFVLLNSGNDEIAGVSLLGDAYDLARVCTTDGCHPYMIEVLDYLAELYFRVEDQLPKDPKPGVLMKSYALGTSVEKSREENVHLAFTMVREQDRRTEQQKYQWWASQSTHSLVRTIAEFMGNKRLLTDRPNHYVNKFGERPFIRVPDSKVVTVEAKKYSC